MKFEVLDWWNSYYPADSGHFSGRMKQTLVLAKDQTSGDYGLFRLEPYEICTDMAEIAFKLTSSNCLVRFTEQELVWLRVVLQEYYS